MKFNTDLVKTDAVLKIYITLDDISAYMNDSIGFGKSVSHKVKEFNNELTESIAKNIAGVNICFDPGIPHIIQFGMMKKIGKDMYAAYTNEDIPYLLYQIQFFTNINKFMIRKLRKKLYYTDFLGEIIHTTEDVLNMMIERNFE